MTDATYEDRNIDLGRIRSIDNEGSSLTLVNGWTMLIPESARGKMEVDDHIILEHKGFNLISGAMLLSLDGGEWLWHDTDQEIQARHDEWTAEVKERRQKYLDEHREELRVREAALPEVLRKRLENFRNHGGDEFELSGWGYELVVCELIVMYAASSGEESEEISEFAGYHGTSGNQHEYAKAAAKYMGTEDEDKLAGSVSALSPITGDADYSNAGK